MMSFRASSRVYAHVDCNSFFASCEVFRNPSLRGKCVCVGDQIVIAASYEAKRRGVKTGTPMWEAERLIPTGFVRILPDHAFYVLMSSKLMAHVAAIVGKVEPFSVDEFFADVTDFADTRTTDGYFRFAENLKATIYREVGLKTSIGIGHSRIRAKMFSEINKPFGSFAAFSPDTVESLFSRLPVREIPFIARGSCERLGSGVRTVLDFYRLSADRVRQALGKNGLALWLELHGADVWAPVPVDRPAKSVSSTRSFNRAMTSDPSALWRHLVENLERAYDALVRQKQEARSVAVMFRDKEFAVRWAGADLGDPTIDRKAIGKAVRECFGRLLSEVSTDVPIRSTGVRFEGLSPYVPKQTTIFEADFRTHERDDRLAAVLDKLKARYGKDVAHRGFVSDARPPKTCRLPVLYEAG